MLKQPFANLIGRVLVHWLPLAVAITGLSGLAYVAVQQDLRQSANDPQIQLAEDAAAALTGGGALDSVVPAGRVDMATSLSPYLIVFDDNGQPVAASVQLNGRTPTVPPGVFPDVRREGQARFTWQPQPGVRSAAVMLHYNSPQPGFVLAGRSLREVEQRESNSLLLATVAGGAALAASLVATVVVEALRGG